MTRPPAEEPPVWLDRGGSTPLYVQLANLRRGKIERGEWRPDQKIPSENELNRMYWISRMTARQVLAQLVHEELLFRVQGKGTFVAHRKIGATSPAYLGIREQLQRGLCHHHQGAVERGRAGGREGGRTSGDSAG